MTRRPWYGRVPSREPTWPLLLPATGNLQGPGAEVRQDGKKCLDWTQVSEDLADFVVDLADLAIDALRA